MIYIFYGFRHSIENTTTSSIHSGNDDVNPEEQRILIPVGGEGHVTSGAVPTTSTSVGQQQRPRDTLSRDELTMALSV